MKESKISNTRLAIAGIAVVAVFLGIVVFSQFEITSNPAGEFTMTRYSCGDSDGGRNYNTAGTVTITQYPLFGAARVYRTLSDGCVNSATVGEAFCQSSNSIGTETFNCPYGCLAGKCNTAPTYVCTDSDGGLAYAVAGIVTIKSNNVVTSSYSDACINNMTLMEGHCASSSAATHSVQNYNCPTGCLVNRCR